MENSNFYKIGFFTLLILIIVVFSSSVSYMLGKKTAVNPEETVIETATIKSYPQEPKPEIVAPITTPTPFEADVKELIKASVLLKTKLTEDKATIMISQMNDSYAKGTVKEKSEVGGAYFLATKVGTKWVTTYTGQSSPLCAEVDPFNYPKSMVAECLDDQGDVVVRK